MAAELKPGRTYHEALRRIGVQNPGEVQIGVPVQLVAEVDSLGHLQPPVPVAIASGGHYCPAVAGERGVPCEWQILSPGGAWIVGCSSLAGELGVANNAASRITRAAVVLVPALNTGGLQGAPALRSIYSSGYNDVGPAAITEGWELDVGALGMPPFWVPMGQFVSIIGRDVNQNQNGCIMIQEVP